MKIKAVLFDCDGLMFDTENYSHRIWNRIAEEEGVRLPDDFFMMITGAGRKNTEAYMNRIEGIEKVLPKARAERFNLDAFRKMEKDALTKPGLIELTKWLQAHGYLTAVCSSSNSEYVRTLISTVSEKLEYDAIVGGDMTTRGKPDPEIFLLGAKTLGIDPENCLVLEDSKQGVIAAKRAGMHSCFIPDTVKPDAEMEEAIEYRRNSLREVIGLLEEENEYGNQ